MSIAINSNFERDQLLAVAGQTVFTYSFPIFDESYLTVYKRPITQAPHDADDLLILGVDYSVSGVGDEAGGYITLTSPAALNDLITLVGTEPIERESVFDDYNPFTVALNQQLNEQTVMQQQTYTYWANLSPHYNYNELVSAPTHATPGVRPDKLILPMLPDGHVWVGRGSLGTDPDDIITEPYTSGGGGGGSGDLIEEVDQPGHNFIPTDWIRFDKTSQIYERAIATTRENAEVVGVVIESNIPAGTFKVQQAGHISSASAVFSGLTPGQPYFLSPTVLGAMQVDDVFEEGQVSRPVFLPDGTDKGWILPYRGVVDNGVGDVGDSGGGGGGTDTNIDDIDQPGNTFQVGNWVYLSANETYSLTQPTTLAGAQGVGVVILAGDPTFRVQFSGINTGAVTGAVNALGVPIPIVGSTVYYLSDVVNGAITPVVPSGITQVSKPAFISSSEGNAKGWILPQRPLPATISNPNIAPRVYLGVLDKNNSFSSETILLDSDGNFFGAYEIIIHQFQGISTDYGIRASGVGSIGIGFQFFIDGAWQTAFGRYASYISGISSSAGLNTSTPWGLVANAGLGANRNYCVVMPNVTSRPTLTAGCIILTTELASQSMTFTAWGVNLTPASPVGYSISGYAGCDAGTSRPTGIRVAVGGPGAGALDLTSDGYIVVYGIPQATI